jgi:hypothetical protein
VALLDQRTEYIYLVRAELSDPARLTDWHAWYEDRHIPRLLSVPGFVSATRYAERPSATRFLAAYEIESPAVFDEPRYREITGWEGWQEHLSDWRRAVYRVVEELPGGGGGR